MSLLIAAYGVPYLAGAGLPHLNLFELETQMTNEHDTKALLAALNKITIPTKSELLVLGVGYGKRAFSSGMVLRDTHEAIGQPMSVTTLHRALDTLLGKKWISEVGAMIDDVSARPVVGYALTKAGERKVRYYAGAVNDGADGEASAA